ncbi:ATP-dependent DNA helicase, RecQ family [Longilinea arvoryzae]|uniref:ATP-dependent DNA helicase RecQ n=1 Tax=Longilinea arvoryzae TaxID=360412 RepID=A0A0S7BD37_9CHLR|nr:RecQ family ATP-dependent DNA helicase [Longilinea arvoryzae]GAP12628.1 ATP-dependent DNA helicase, RecQ family [Longilinea arvoryzae]
MTLDEQVLLHLRTSFGFDSFRPGQREALHSLLDGRDTLVVMPTGAGKSLIFQLAALQLPGLTLVISPLIALMKDQVDGLTGRGIPATFINSALPPAEQTARLARLARGAFRIVYIAPERLRSIDFLGALKNRPISLLAVDEAHCISEWGHDFRPDYLNIARWRGSLPPHPPLTIALTATATPQVQKDILRLLGLADDAVSIVTGFNRPNLSLNVCYTGGERGKLGALKELAGSRQDGAVIVYTGTRRDAEAVAEFAGEVLQRPAEFYHAGLPAEERTRIQNDFITGKSNFIAATNAFGMGIDRADVRQVIHYALPGSLEAYYQEAGRAGRDGLPARTALLYDPKDRALQEHFVRQSDLGTEDLLALRQALPAGKEFWTTLDDLSRLSELQSVQIKVGLSMLERAGALEHLGDEGLRLMYRRGAWNPERIDEAIAHNTEYLRNRQQQLEAMIAYAESNRCRRRILLQHFGDAAEPRAGDGDCCDNCRNRAPAANSAPPDAAAELSEAERTALVILDCVRRVKIKVGVVKLAQVLNGSRAKEILQFHHEKDTYYGRLAALRQKDIEGLIDRLVGLGHLKIVGGDFPVLNLTPRGENAIRQKERIPLRLTKLRSRAEVRREKARRTVNDSVACTAELLADGLTPEQIARQRELAVSTIYIHCERLITAGKLNLNQVISADVRAQIEAAIRQAGSTEQLAPIKALLPEEIDYGMIRCVAAAYRPAPQPDPTGAAPDAVDAFLTRPHPRPLNGPWDCGWSLDFHSHFSGGDWARSGVGDLTYRLKYEGDLSVLPALVDHALHLLQTHPELGRVNAVLPVPPSLDRPNDPVRAFCSALSSTIKMPLQSGLIKARPTRPQKELKSLAQKRANVCGAFALQADVHGKRLLVVDDLFDSGATLEEITGLLRKHGAAGVHVLTLTRTIHSDQ